MMSFNGRPIVLKISRKSDRKSFKYCHLIEFPDRFLDRFFNDFELCDPIKGALSALYRHQSTADTTPNTVRLVRSLSAYHTEHA